MTDAELRALALKIVEGRVFGFWNVPEDLWRIVFMPLSFMKKRELMKHKGDTVYAIHGEDKAVPGRAINGYPMFAECRFLPRAHFEQVNALVKELHDQRYAFLKTAPTPAAVAPLIKRAKRAATPRKKGR
jgi:hypothetical protein